MLSISRAIHPQKAVNNELSFSERFPKDDKGVYNQLYGRFLAHSKDLIDTIYNGKGQKFPIGTELIESYLTGYKVNYIPFDNSWPGLRNIDGCWEFDEVENGVVNIYYNENAPTYRQHFTKIHESIHLCQWLDGDVRFFIDEMLLKNLLPREMVEKLVERITERTAAMYLMPEKVFVEEYRKSKSVLELAKQFRVSIQSTMYRLQECGIIVTN